MTGGTPDSAFWIRLWRSRRPMRTPSRSRSPDCGRTGAKRSLVTRSAALAEPVFGHLYETELLPSGAELDPDRYENLAIEGEFAIRLACDVPDAHWLRTHRGEAIATVFPVIELHNYVFRRTPHTAAELIANNGLHAGVVLPRDEMALARIYSPSGEPVSVLRNGELLGTATGETLPDFPFGSLIRLAGHLERTGRQLLRDQLVLIGSPLPLYPVSEGDAIDVRCPGWALEVSARVCRPVAARNSGAGASRRNE